MRKAWGVLVACALGALSTPAIANAEQYTVQVCLQPGPAAGEQSDLAVIGPAAYNVSIQCAEPGLSGVRITGGGGATGVKGLQIVAPAGAKIVSARLFHNTLVPAGSTLRVIAARGGTESTVASWSGPVIAGSAGQASAQEPAGDPIALGGAADALRYEIDCPANCDGLDLRLYAIRVVLDDADVPSVGVSAQAAGSAIDTQVQAGDLGSGVSSLRVLIDGQVVESRTFPCGKRLAPCPPATDLTLSHSSDSLADGTHRLRVEVTDHAGRTSVREADVVVDRRPPVPLGAPAVIGAPEVGSTLIAATGAWSGESYTLAHRWERCRAGVCVAIPNSDGASYVVRDEDQEHELRVVEVATDRGGSTEQRSTTAPPVAPQVPVLSEPLALAGEERVGGRLNAVAGTWRNAVSLRYQWMSCTRRDGTDCVVLPGRERAFLDIEREDVGRYLVLTVTAIGPRGHTRQTSAASGRIPSPPLRNLTEPSVGGTATVGGRLTAETGAWEGTGVQFELQWLRCASNGCLPVEGAISRNYAPTTKDLGRTLVVLVTARDALGETMPIRSRPSERVRSKGSQKALAVPRVRTRVRIVSFGEYQFALTVGPLLQVLDVSSNSRVDVLCRLCAKARLGRRSKVKGGSVRFKLPADGVQIPPGGQIVVRVRRKGSIGREIVGTLSLDRSRRVSWSQPRCLDKDASLRTVACPAKAKPKPKSKSKGKSKSTSTPAPSTTSTTTSAGLAVPLQ